MTRYFYPASRAHHAYSMALDFGMKFERRSGKWSLDGLRNIDPSSDCRIYVHSDSLHLLEPQDLDIIYRTNGYCQTVGIHIGIPKTLAQLAAGACIIQRNGVPFHQPVVEA